MVEKVNLDAKQAVEVMYTTGKSKFKNLIYKRIREAAENGEYCIVHSCTDVYMFSEDDCVTVGVDPAIINEVQLELKDKGFDVSVIHDENGAITMHISWGRLLNN